ncbi:hypothetical protein GCM10025768_03600 [Microbacterium pseudoresistens]
MNGLNFDGPRSSFERAGETVTASGAIHLCVERQHPCESVGDIHRCRQMKRIEAAQTRLRWHCPIDDIVVQRDE